MSLYPSPPRYRGPRLRGGEALDALSSRFARWCDLVEASKATAALGSAALELRAIRDAGFPESLGSPARARPGARGWHVASACWKHWRHFVLLSKKRAPLTSSLVERECAVVAFKHWRFAARGRPVAHDACVVVAWKHWRFLCVEMAAKHKKAEALRLTFERRRFVKIKWEDETVNRANRRAYDLETRRKKLDELYGLDPESKYGSAARAAPMPRRDKKETHDAPTLAETREKCFDRGFLPKRFRVRVRSEAYGFSFPLDEEEGSRNDGTHVPMTPLSHSRSSRAFGSWRRFVRRTKAEAIEKKRRDDLYKKSSLDDASQNDPLDEDAALLSLFAEGGEASSGISAMAVASAAARRAARRDLRLREKRKLDAIAARRPLPPDKEKEEEAFRERELQRRRDEAAVLIQACFRGFLARNRALTLRGRRDAYALERVRGLRALLDRGQATFSKDQTSHKAAMELWAESETRLAALRFRNEEAMTRVKLARSRLTNVQAEAKTGRARVTMSAKNRLKTHREWDKLWAPLREWNDPTRIPFPSFPGTKTKNAKKNFSRRMNNHEGVSGLAASSPLDDVAFGRHAPPDETAYKRSVS
jgi:hypothetical protein